MFCRSLLVLLWVFLLLVISLFVILRLTVHDYPFDIFKPFLFYLFTASVTMEQVHCGGIYYVNSMIKGVNNQLFIDVLFMFEVR